MAEQSGQYQWLSQIPENHEDYLAPTYYDQVLRKYSFGGREDLDILDDYLDTLDESSRVLELGCGSGRATERILKKLGETGTLDLVDLSSEMVAHCRDKFKDDGRVTTHRSDSVDFLANDNAFDGVISLWNLSHSVHQHMFRLGRQEGAKYVGKTIGNFLTNNLATGGSAHLIHYDIQSPEQKLINPWRLKLWETADPTYDATGQSPSKELLDEVLDDLREAGEVDYDCAHLEGDPIVYENTEAALEAFLNFHMEGHFNQLPELEQVIASLEDGFRQYTQQDGTVHIAPGAFVYNIQK